MALSAEGSTLLKLLGDYAIGGVNVTPAAESYSNLHVSRVPLRTVDEWTNYEAVHINAAKRSMEAACLKLRINPPLEYMDRVLLMDFDNRQPQDAHPSKPVRTHSALES